jgi:ribosomal protein S18 acetylase RimI-like enzyme
MIRRAVPADLDLVRELFREYSSSVDAPECFTAFEREIAALPAGYDAIWVAGTLGCAGLRRLSPEAGEMKRLYVRPEGRGRGLARLLVEAVMEEARARGYQALRLDTLESMTAAKALYLSMGFRQIERYNETPGSGTLFFERSP